MIRGICFDLDGVYFLNGKSNFVHNLVNLGITESEVQRVFLKSDKMNKEYKLGKIDDNEYWTWAISEWKLKLSVGEIVELLIKGYETNDSAVNYVKKVRSVGYKTIICSNNFPARIRGLQKRFGFLNDFDFVTLSYQVGIDKPNILIFEDIIKRSGLNAKEIVYSDDDESKMTGAKQLGINTYLYTDFDAFVEHLESLGVNI